MASDDVGRLLRMLSWYCYVEGVSSGLSRQSIGEIERNYEKPESG
jgi:hypothetical protein